MEEQEMFNKHASSSSNTKSVEKLSDVDDTHGAAMTAPSGYENPLMMDCLNMLLPQQPGSSDGNLSTQLDPESLNRFANFSCDLAQFDFTDVSDPAVYDVLKIPGYKITVIILYVIVILLGGIGNTMVVLTVIKTRAMWTATNIFIANLALADVFVCLLDLPFTAYYQLTDDWIFGETLCYIIPMVFGIVVYSSTLTLTMIAIDRYMLILFPLSKRMTLTIAMFLLVLIMVISIAVASPIAIYGNYMKIDDPLIQIHRTYCFEKWPAEKLRRIYTVSTLMLQYVLPLLIIGILYTRIFRRISRRMTQNKNSRRTKTTKMLVAVVAVFACAWTPFHIHSILSDFNVHPIPPRYFKFVDALFRVLALSSSCINPLLYGWLNDNFRTAFLSLIKRPTAVPTGIHREDDSVASRKTMLTVSPARKLYTKVIGGGHAKNNNSCTPSCCSTHDLDSPENMPLQTVAVVDKNGHGVVVKATNSTIPQPFIPGTEKPSDSSPEEIPMTNGKVPL